MGRTASVAGASGLVGDLCLQLLLADDSYDCVIAVLRRPLAMRHAKLRQEIVDFDRLEERPVCAIDTAFCALGTLIRTAGSQAAFRRVDHDYVESFARWAKAGGAQAFALVSSVGASAGSSTFYLRTKGEAEESVKRVGFRDTHVFRPSILVGERPKLRLTETVVAALMRAAQFALVGGLRRYRATPALDVARAMVAACASGDPGQHVYEYPEIVRLATAYHGR